MNSVNDICHNSIHVLLIDDSESIRDMVKRVLKSQDHIHVTDEAENAISAMEIVQHGFDGVVVIDINLPELDGIEAIRQMKRILPELPIVVLSFQSDVRYVQESFKAGATGFVLKERAFEDLPEAIRSVACNNSFISIDIVP